MAVLTQLQLDGSSTVYDLNDARISATSVSTATHFLATNSSVSAINPISASDLASVLGADCGVVFYDLYQKNFDIDTVMYNGTTSLNEKNVRVSFTSKGSATWSGTYPSFAYTGGQLLHFGKGTYLMQILVSDKGFAMRRKFGSWSAWIEVKSS